MELVTGKPVYHNQCQHLKKYLDVSASGYDTDPLGFDGFVSVSIFGRYGQTGY